MRGEIVQLTTELAEMFQEGRQIDVVDDFAYPLPVSVICRLLGIPDKDEQLFQDWTDILVASADIGPEGDTAERDQAAGQAQREMGQSWSNSPNSDAVGPPATCSPTSSTNRIRLYGSARRTSR